MTVIVLSFFVFAGILFVPKRLPVSALQQKMVVETRTNIRSQVEEIKTKLDSNSLNRLLMMEDGFSNSAGAQKVAWLDSMVNFWDEQMRPPVAAVYSEEKANLTGNIDDLIEAGDRYLTMADFLEPDDRTWAYNEARDIFERVLKVQPDNADAKINLGIAMVETSPNNPMQGISLIREVVQKDSTNTRAILQLGHFSILSGQFSNALQRYQQALRVDSTLTEAWFFIGDTYAKMGDMDNAERYLNKYKDLQENEEVKMQIDAYIQELKTDVKLKN